MMATTGGVQSPGGYERIDDSTEITSVEPFTLWAKRMILKPLNLFLAALIIIAAIILCIEHPWDQKHKRKHSLLLQTPYVGRELFDYEEYIFGINSSIILSNSTLDLTIWMIVEPYLQESFIACPNEPYTITESGATSIIKMTSATSPSDCVYKKIHDTLPEKLKVALKDEMQYNVWNEEVTMHFSVLDLVVFDVRMLPITNSPTLNPTSSPTLNPTTEQPSKSPTRIPSLIPTTQGPSRYPTKTPTGSPTSNVTTDAPTKSPTPQPTRSPTSNMTTAAPTKSPALQPTRSPTSNMTTAAPTKGPTLLPTRSPSSNTKAPSTSSPTAQPTKSPKLPTSAPSAGDVPIGFYRGQKTILTYVVNANMQFEQPESCGIQIVIDAAHVNITCTDEEYTMNGNSIELTHVNDEGDCLHDQMKDEVTLKSIIYSKDSNQVTITVKYKFLTKTVDLAYEN